MTCKTEADLITLCHRKPLSPLALNDPEQITYAMNNGFFLFICEKSGLMIIAAREHETRSHFPLCSFVPFVVKVLCERLLQLRYGLQRRLVDLLDRQMFLQPAIAVETGSGVQRVPRVIELHLFILGA